MLVQIVGLLTSRSALIGFKGNFSRLIFKIPRLYSSTSTQTDLQVRQSVSSPSATAARFFPSVAKISSVRPDLTHVAIYIILGTIRPSTAIYV